MQKTSDTETTPPAPFEPVPRPRVLERIRRAAARRIVLVVAPAGFGKSVAVRQYLEADGIPHLRFSVRKEHATLVSFLRGFVAALDPIAPNASKSVASAYEKASRGGKPLQHLANWVASMLRGYAGTIFIDDLHLAEDRSASQLLAEIVDHTGETLKWIISTRELALPHASWLAYGDRDETVDENDLRMSLAEATLACKAYRVAITADDLAQILALTEGWPVALTFALRASARIADLRLVTAGTREITYNYLADQVFRKLSDAQRNVLLETCLFVRIDARILSQLSHDLQRQIQHLRRQATFIVVEAPGTYRYHDLFRDFLEHELRSLGSAEYTRVVEDSGAVLLAAGYYDQALALHLLSGSRASTERLLLDYGWRILEAGAFDRVAPALAMIGLGVCAQSAILLGLLARIEEGRGRFEESDKHYKRAIEIALDAEAIARLSEKLAVSLLNRFMLDEAYSVVGSLDIAGFSDAGIVARLWALRSAIEVLRGAHDEAGSCLNEALKAIAEEPDEATTAVVYHFAAYVYLWLGRMKSATDCAIRSLDLSRDLGMFDLSGRTCSVLYEASGALDDQDRLRWCLEEISRLAALSGDPLLLQYALFCRYDSAVEKGDFEAASALEQEVDREQVVDEERWAQTVLAADAMRAACSGEFGRAFSIGCPWRLEKLPLTVRALRAAELALYASAAQISTMADELRMAESLLEKVLTSPGEGTTVRARKTVALVSLALLLQGRPLDAASSLDRLGKTKIRDNGVWLLVGSCRVACRYALGSANARDFAESLKRLDGSRFAGYARLLRVLPVWSDLASRLGTLTTAELKVLQLLKAGHSSKEIGGQLSRSRLTVDTHVKSILRKLECASRREAVALFTRSNDEIG